LGALKVFVFFCNTLKITLLHPKMCFIYEFFGLKKQLKIIKNVK